MKYNNVKVKIGTYGAWFTVQTLEINEDFSFSIVDVNHERYVYGSQVKLEFKVLEVA